MNLSKKSKVLLPVLLAFVLVFSMIGAYADTPLPEETNADAAITEQDIELEDAANGGGYSLIDSEEDSTIADEPLAVEEPEAIEEPAEELPVQGPIQIEGLSEISTLGIEDEEEDTPIVNALANPDATVTAESGVGIGLNEAIAAAPTDGTLYTIAVDAPINITAVKTIASGKNIVITSTNAVNQLTKTTAGAAFTISGGGELTLEGITLNGFNNNNSALITFGTGGGEFNLESDATIQNNTTTSNGGAIFAQNLPNIVININGGTIKNNTAANGGAIYAIGNSTANKVTLNINSGAKFIDNTAGGAVSARQGGAIYFGNYVTTTITGSTFRDNTAYGHGGAISGTGAVSSFSMTSSIVRDNKAIPTAAVYGGGIFLNNIANSTITGSSFNTNEATPSAGGNYVASGGGLYVATTGTDGTAVIANSTFANNKAISQGTGTGYGGGLYVNSNLITSLPGITATGNESTSTDAANRGNGGGIFVTAAYLNTISGATITGNTAAQAGGGAYIAAAALTSVSGSTFSGNHALTGAGGGLWYGNASDVTLNNDTITGNDAKTTGGGVHVGTAGADGAQRSLTLSGTTTVSNNEAGTTGGGINGVHYLNLTLKDTVKINNNTAGTNGGGVYTGTANHLVLEGDAKINNNTAGTSGGGVIMGANGTATAPSLTMSGNAQIVGNTAAQEKAGNYGGIQISNAVAGYRTQVELSGNAKINNNYAGYKADGTTATGFTGSYGGISIGNFADVTLTDNAQINGNKAVTNYGALAIGTDSVMRLTVEAQINNNVAETGGYSGLRMGTNGTFEMNGDTSISYNQSATGYTGIGMSGSKRIDIFGNAKINHNVTTNGTTSTGAAVLQIGETGVVNLHGHAEVAYNTAPRAAGFNTYGGDNATKTNTTNIYEDATIHDNIATVGDTGGTNVSTKYLYIRDNIQIFNNSAGGYGGGLSTDNNVGEIIEISDDVKIYNNTSGANGGGIYAGNLAQLTISDNVQIYENAANSGAGIYHVSGILDISGDVKVLKNTAVNAGGGIYSVGNVTLSDRVHINENIQDRQAIFADNGQGGGGINAKTLTATDYVQINDNISKGSAGGGGVYAKGLTRLSGHVTINKNTGAMGGGLLLRGADDGVNVLASISGDVVIDGNEAYSDASNQTPGRGGGIFFNPGVGTLEISDRVKITNNTSKLRGGGGIFDRGGDSSVIISGDVLIDGNRAIKTQTNGASDEETGGGGMLSWPSNRPVIISGNVVITNNSTDANGGGLNIITDWYPDPTTGSYLSRAFVGPDVTFDNNVAGSFAQGVLPGDIASYDAHIDKANSTWSNSPSTGVPFLRGYNNYDISYSIPGLDKHTVKFVLTGEDDVVRTTEYKNIYVGTHWEDVIVVPNANPSSSHFSFNGWSEDIPAGDFVINGDKTFTGSFKIDSHLVRYFANNGSGATYLTMLYKHGQAGVTVKDADSLVMAGYTFKGWATTADATAIEYAAGASLAIEDDVDLYAVWEKNAETPTTPDVPDEPEIVTPDVEDPEVTTPITTTPDVDNPTVAAPTPATPDVDSPAVATAEATPPTAPATTTDVDGGNNEAVGTVNTPVDTPANGGQTTNPLEELSNGNVPLGGLGTLGGWSLVSLIFSMVAVVIAALLIISRRRKEDDGYRYADDEELTEKKRSRLLKIITIAAGFLTLIVWLVLDNFSEPMVWINRNTLYVGIVLLITLASLVIYKIRKSDKDGEYAAE